MGDCISKQKGQLFCVGNPKDFELVNMDIKCSESNGRY